MAAPSLLAVSHPAPRPGPARDHAILPLLQPLPWLPCAFWHPDPATPSATPILPTRIVQRAVHQDLLCAGQVRTRARCQPRTPPRSEQTWLHVDTPASLERWSKWVASLARGCRTICSLADSEAEEKGSSSRRPSHWVIHSHPCSCLPPPPLCRPTFYVLSGRNALRCQVLNASKLPS